MTKKFIFFGAFFSILLGIGFIFSISVGAKTLSLQTVWNGIFHYQKDVLDLQLVHDLRLPRAVCAILVGGFLGVTGAMLQGITRNPIAEPSIMGITQGASLFVTLSIVSSTLSKLGGRTVFAFAGALLSGLFVLLFSMQNTRNMNLSKLLLVGTAVSTFFISLTSVLALVSNRSQELAFWVAGGLRSANWEQVVLLLSVGGVCTILSFCLSRKINIISLGEDIAVTLGASPSKVRIQTMLLLIPLCAVSVTVAGNIAFVGLVIPHILRKLFGNDYRILIPFSFLGGSTLVIWSDIAARMANAPYETPIGLFTSILGVPFFLYLVRKETC